MTDVSVSVSRGSVVEHVVPLEGATTVRWSVAVAGGDIGLEALFIAANSRGGGVLHAAARVKGASGSYSAPSAGRVIFKLDNSFSLLRGKTVAVEVRTGDALSSADVLNSALMNDRVMKGIELFFTNRFTEAEAFFATEKDRVSPRPRRAAVLWRALPAAWSRRRRPGRAGMRKR
jgi:hypothetical protein